MKIKNDITKFQFSFQRRTKQLKSNRIGRFFDLDRHYLIIFQELNLNWKGFVAGLSEIDYHFSMVLFVCQTKI